MGKKLGRILSAALAVLMVLAALSPAASLAAPSENEITRQIRKTYQKALSSFGRSSFDGYCGTLISSQIQILGITSGTVHGNGNEQYDQYCSQEVTSGGYRVTAYPAGRFTLEEALLDITDGGTKDAYNILVGFERTKSVAGRKYGHAVLIHAIFDGLVYFVESYDVRLNGTRYPEGDPIICSIGDFCDYYASTTVELDGVISFGLKDYEDHCDRYSANLTAVLTENTELMTLPCTAEVHGSSALVRAAIAGEELAVIGLYRNTQGEYWYQTGEGFFPAAAAAVQALRFDDVTVTDAVAPTVLRKSGAFKVKGQVTAVHNSIYTLRAQVFRLDGETETEVLNATDVVEGQEYSLSGSDISKNLKFRSLDVGQYRYKLAAIVGNYYCQDGQLQVGWETVELWKSDFQVMEDKTSSYTVSFDAGEGLADWNQTAVVKGDPLEELPGAQLDRYAFQGWFTEDGQAVTADYVPEGDVTLYAGWYSLADLNADWNSSQSRFVSTVGLSTMGCAEVNGTLYYFSSFGQGWVVWNQDGTVVN